MPKPKSSDLIKLDDVSAMLLELAGVTRCRATIYNWVNKGRPNYANKLVKLKCSKRLGNFYTTKEWVLDFIREIR